MPRLNALDRFLLKNRMRTGLLFSVALLALAPSTAYAQAVDEQNVEPQGSATGAAGALSDDIVITARKRATAERLQDVPLAVTAFGEEQLDAKFVRNLEGLSNTIPNVQLLDAGNVKGTANFSIRGLGVNSTIPSVEPTVGVFVDGVYLGVNLGVVFDNFDLEAIEVLRGPQGTLFGRNVTGGAVVVRTTTPGNEWRANARFAVETGLNKIASAAISGPIIDDELAVKLAVYYKDDDGWFRNDFNGRSLGKSEHLIVRPAISWTPGGGPFRTVLKLEHSKGDGQGSAQQNFAVVDRDSFDVNIDFEGLSDFRANSVFSESTLEVGFGNGVITNIAGYREYRDSNGLDLDATPQLLFTFYSFVDQDQFSDELRYAGTFGPVELTVGLYYFTQDILYLEDRYLSGGAVNITGGGEQHQKSYGAFAAADWKLTDTLTLNLGGRYTWEKKRAAVARTRVGACNYAERECNFDQYLNMSTVFKGFTPRIGLQWRPDGETQLYGYYARGLRSGGYNLRHSSASLPPGPTDQEVQDSFEAGLKREFGRGNRINLAAFYNKLKDVQREINLRDDTFAAVQLFRNVADATFKGFEVEAQVMPISNLVLSTQAGYTHAKYSNVRFDLTGDGVIDAADKALKPPRLSPWTYGFGATYDVPLSGLGVLTARGNFYHRDANFYTDNNLAVLEATDFVDASISYTTENNRWSFSVYGKNLTNEVNHSTYTLLPPTFGGPGASSSALGKGRVIGAELSFRY